VNDFNRFLKSPQLRALLQHLDSSSIRNKVETERLSPAVARFWLTTMRAQLRQIEDLVGEIANELNRLPRGQHNDVQDTG
jgi:hypothetical protein